MASRGSSSEPGDMVNESEKPYDASIDLVPSIQQYIADHPSPRTQDFYMTLALNHASLKEQFKTLALLGKEVRELDSMNEELLHVQADLKKNSPIGNFLNGKNWFDSEGVDEKERKAKHGEYLKRKLRVWEATLEAAEASGNASEILSDTIETWAKGLRTIDGAMAIIRRVFVEDGKSPLCGRDEFDPFSCL